MNSFKIFVYNNLAKTWSEIPNVAFPLSTGDYLDERLDECYVTFYNDVKHYTSSTVFKIIVDEDGTETVLYYVLDSDSSNEIKVGAGLYKHSLHLLEPTKLLEGILCQTISFTNELGADPSNASTYLLPIFAAKRDNEPNFISGDTLDDAAKTAIIQKISALELSAIYSTDSQISFPSIEKIAGAFCAGLNESIGGNVFQPLSEGWYYAQNNGPIYYPVRLTVTQSNGGSVSTDDFSEDFSVTTSADSTEITLTYQIAFENTGPHTNLATTLTFTASVVGSLSPTLPYTITAMVNRCLMLAEPLFFGPNFTPRFKFDGCHYRIDGIVTYSEGSQAELYDKVFADEIVLTNATLREQLKGIGKLIHAEPRVYVTEDEEDGKADLNFWVKYDKYGVVTEAQSLAGKPYCYKALSQSINEYCTSIHSNAANLVNSLDYGVGVVTEPLPATDMFRGDQAVKSLRAESTGVQIKSENGIAETSCPIYNTVKIECGMMDRSGTYRLPLTDITAFVFEKAYYDLLSSYGTLYLSSKAYAIYYTQGQPNLNGLFFKAATPGSTADEIYNYYAIVNILALASGKTGQEINSLIAKYGEASLVFRITYIPMYATTLQHSKQLYVPGELPYSQIYNQSENVIEARYYGENVKGVAAKLGNVCEERTYLLRYRTELPRTGDMLGEYSIASVSAETFPGYTKCTIALSKDYNRLNEFVGINSHKRVYEVSEREAYNRDVLFHENVVFSKEPLSDSPGMILISPKLAIHNLTNTDTISQIGTVLAETYVREGYLPNNLTPKIALKCRVDLPVVSAAFGNCIVFTWKYKDNYSAGQTTEYITEGDISGNWGVEVPYGDEYGRSDFYNFYLFNYGFADWHKANAPYAYTTPAVKGYFNEELAKNLSLINTGYSGYYVLKKDSREVINTVNYEIEFRTTEPDLVIGSALASSNPLVTERKQSYIYALKNPVNKFMRTLSIEDVYTDENGDPVLVTLNTAYIEGNRIIFPSSRLGYPCYWAIATELVKTTKGPFLFPDGTTNTVTEWTGGELLLAGLNEVLQGGKIYNDLYIAVRR